MKEILLNKLSTWSAEEVASRYNIDNPLKNYLWETTDNGAFLYRNSKIAGSDGISGIHYFTNDGVVHKITDRFTENDYSNHQRLYQLSQETNDFRIDVPISNERFTHNGVAYSYTVVERPNKEHGTKIFDKVFDKSLTDSDLLRYIDDVAIMLTRLKSLDCLLPDVGLDITMQFKDSKGYFWSDFKIWNRSYPDFVEKTIALFKDNVAILNAQVGTLDANTIIETAETKWQAI